MSTNDRSEILKSLPPPITPLKSSKQSTSSSYADENDKPLVIIERKGWASWINFREIWQYRELLYFLMWRDVKVRYKQTALGVIWVILQPLLMMLIFTFIFGGLGGIRSQSGVSYPLFAYAGLLPWTFFSAAATISGNSMVGSAGLITKVYFPRLIIPMAAVGAVLLDLAISLGVLALLMLYWRVAPGRGLLMLPVLILLVTVLALGFGILMAAVNVKYRDVRIVMPFIIQVWFFLSPIVYPMSLVPERWRWLMALNPMTGIAGGFRASLYAGQKFDWPSLASSAVIALVLFSFAVLTFRRMEKEFADVI